MTEYSEYTYQQGFDKSKLFVRNLAIAGGDLFVHPVKKVIMEIVTGNNYKVNKEVTTGVKSKGVFYSDLDIMTKNLNIEDGKRSKKVNWELVQK